MKRTPHRERGIALLIALLAVALAAVLIAGLLDRGELALARTRNALRVEQAQAYAQALEASAAEILVKDDETDKGEDTNADIWAVPLPPQQVPGGMIFASMRDLNGCFNLNNLADRDSGWSGMFNNLLDARGVDEELTTAIEEWLDAGDDTADGWYLAQPVAYRRAERMFTHVSELRLVRGVTSEIYARLALYVCALPAGTTININTATPPVLQTLGKISAAQAESLWQDGHAHWKVGEPWQQTWRDMGIDVDMTVATSRYVGLSSNYFLARGDIVLDGIPFTFYSLIERGAQGMIRVLARSRGSDDTLAAPALPEQPARH